MSAMDDQGDLTTDKTADNEPAPVLRLEPRRLERRIPGVGIVRFRAPAAAAEEALEPLYAEGGVEARAFVNALVAACVESPHVEAADVDGWSERARAIARVAAAQTIGCFAAYRRFADSGLGGDERLREAMKKRKGELAERLRLAMAALGPSLNVTRMFDPSRLTATGAVERMLRQQRQIDQLVKPNSVIARNLRQPFVIGRLTQFEQLTKLPSSQALDAVTKLSRSSLYGQIEQLKKLNSLATPRGITNVANGVAGIGRITELGSPSYFGALRGVGRLPDYSKLFGNVGRIPDSSKLFGNVGRIPDYSKLFGNVGRIPDYSKLFGSEQFHGGGNAFAFQFDAVSRVLERFRQQLAGPFRAYLAWVEHEWALAKAEHRPAPVLFVLASLPALIGLQLLEELRADDEPLLSSLEGELRSGTLATELQSAIQRIGLLDSVAKRHLAQGVDWVAAGRYVDAAPPLYQGLERAFRLTARDRGVVDAHGNFLVPGARRTRMRKIEDTFHHLALEHLYLRFLRAWVFGEVGNLARHGDLPELEHRKWVLRAVVGLVGWLEYVGGEEDAVAELVERLELQPAEDYEVIA
jgi:hypothetical protein